MKKWLKNNKGLTLVELLAVIVILGIVVAIAVPSIGNVIENSKGKADNATIELVKDAATRWSINEQAEGNAGTATNSLMTVLTNSGFLAKVPSAFQTDKNITITSFSVTTSATGAITVTLYDQSTTPKIISYDSATKKVKTT